VNQIDEWNEESDLPPPNPASKIFFQPCNCGVFACTASNVFFIAFLAAGEVAKPVGVRSFATAADAIDKERRLSICRIINMEEELEC
jgi:hypothetical protein